MYSLTPSDRFLVVSWVGGGDNERRVIFPPLLLSRPLPHHTPRTRSFGVLAVSHTRRLQDRQLVLQHVSWRSIPLVTVVGAWSRTAAASRRRVRLALAETFHSREDHQCKKPLRVPTAKGSTQGELLAGFLETTVTLCIDSVRRCLYYGVSAAILPLPQLFALDRTSPPRHSSDDSLRGASAMLIVDGLESFPNSSAQRSPLLSRKEGAITDHDRVSDVTRVANALLFRHAVGGSSTRVPTALLSRPACGLPRRE